LVVGAAVPSGDQWFLPDRTGALLGVLRTVASAESDNRNVNGICVPSWTMARDNVVEVHDIPSSGFRIADRLGPIGRLERRSI
jgi:hypothetical protein